MLIKCQHLLFGAVQPKSTLPIPGPAKTEEKKTSWKWARPSKNDVNISSWTKPNLERTHVKGAISSLAPTN